MYIGYKDTNNIFGYKAGKEENLWICQVVKPKPALSAVLKIAFTTPKTIPALQATFRLETAQHAPVAKLAVIPLKQDSNLATISDSF